MGSRVYQLRAKDNAEAVSWENVINEWVQKELPFLFFPYIIFRLKIYTTFLLFTKTLRTKGYKSDILCVYFPDSTFVTCTPMSLKGDFIFSEKPL